MAKVRPSQAVRRRDGKLRRQPKTLQELREAYDRCHPRSGADKAGQGMDDIIQSHITLCKLYIRVIMRSQIGS